jgi:hypothetical protein
VIQPDLRATIRAVTVVSFTVLGLIWIALAGACPMSDWYARRVPPRSYRQVALADVLRDLENHAVIPLGTVWEAEELKALPVTIDLLFFPTDREAVRLIAEKAGIVLAYPMDTHGGILGPIHVRNATSAPPGVQWIKVDRWEGPIYAAERPFRWIALLVCTTSCSHSVGSATTGDAA